MHETMIKMLDEVKQLLMATDNLNAFADWPDDLIASNSTANLAASKIKCGMAPREKQRVITPGSRGSTGSISSKLAIYLYRKGGKPAFS